jgi:HlyD family secretion protein
LKRLLWLVLIPVAVLGWWAFREKTHDPQIPFARVQRQTLISNLPTNGKVEPIRWQAVRAEQAGLVSRVPVQEGQAVGQGTPLAILRDADLRADLDAAQARLAQARADLATLEGGGKQIDLTTIDNDLALARAERAEDQREYSSLQRLVEKQAATPFDARRAHNKLHAADLQIESLEKRRAALVSKSDKMVATARLQDAEAAVALAKTHLEQTLIRAPIAGVVYNLTARPGAWLNVGDLVADVGQVDRLRVKVYVDEPELGRVEVGQPVAITWDALPGRTWEGAVERKPADIVPLGSRQVGEVLCTIENPGHLLVPGTNVDAHIRTATVPNALTIPKECLRRNAAGPGVFVLRGDHIRWQPVTTGAASITHVQIVSGLAPGDAVALPTEAALHDGDAVRATYP